MSCQHQTEITRVVPERDQPVLADADFRFVDHVHLADDDKWLKPWLRRTFDTEEVLPEDKEEDPDGEDDSVPNFQFICSLAREMLGLGPTRVQQRNREFFGQGQEGFLRVVFRLGMDLGTRFGLEPSEEQKAEFRVIWMDRAFHGTLSI